MDRPRATTPPKKGTSPGPIIPGIASPRRLRFFSPPTTRASWKSPSPPPPAGLSIAAASELEEIKDRLAQLPGVSHTLITIGDTTGKQTRATGDVTTRVNLRPHARHRRTHNRRGMKGITQANNIESARVILADYPDLQCSAVQGSASRHRRRRRQCQNRTLPFRGPTSMALMPQPKKFWPVMQQHPRPHRPRHHHPRTQSRTARHHRPPESP